MFLPIFDHSSSKKTERNNKNLDQDVLGSLETTRKHLQAKIFFMHGSVNCGCLSKYSLLQSDEMNIFLVIIYERSDLLEKLPLFFHM